MTATSDVQNTYDFNIVSTGTDAAHTAHSAAVEPIVGFNFALTNDSDGQTIAAGQTASTTWTQFRWATAVFSPAT
jgi:hypothetical protein